MYLFEILPFEIISYVLITVQKVEVQGVSRDVMHVLPLRFQNKINDWTKWSF
jgi:hypothetical protein